MNYFEQARGLVPDASPIAAEHNEPWPGGRANHYLFDLNRDWIGLTQPEILSQVKALREWLPLVYVDLHEMGAELDLLLHAGIRPVQSEPDSESADEPHAVRQE